MISFFFNYLSLTIFIYFPECLWACGDPEREREWMRDQFIQWLMMLLAVVEGCWLLSRALWHQEAEAVIQLSLAEFVDVPCTPEFPGSSGSGWEKLKTGGCVRQFYFLWSFPFPWMHLEGTMKIFGKAFPLEGNFQRHSQWFSLILRAEPMPFIGPDGVGGHFCLPQTSDQGWA